MTFAPTSAAIASKWIKNAPFALSLALPLALGACASVPPTAPTVSAVAGANVSDQKFARDDSACRARAYAATSTAAAAGQFGLQGQYNSIYSDCMLNRGYEISETVAHYAYGPGPYYGGPGPYYGPGPYVYGGPFYYGWGGGWGRRW